MATFDPISYTYKPTAPRSKSANARRKPVSNQSSILDKLQRSKLSNTALDGALLSAPAAADYNRGYRSGTQAETGISYSSSDDDYLPTVEEILHPLLQEKGSATVDQSPDDIALGIEEYVSEEWGSFIDDGRSAPGDDPSGSLDDPIDLLGSDDSSASDDEIDDGSLRIKSAEPDAHVSQSAETAGNLTIRGHTSSPDELLNMSPRPQLAEEAPTSNSMHSHDSPSHFSEELLYDRIDQARSDSARPQSPPPRQPEASAENRLIEEDYISIGRSVRDEHEHELIPSIFDTSAVNEREEQQQEEEVEAEETIDENSDEDDEQLQEVIDVAAALTAERVSDTHLSGKDGSARPAERRQLLLSHDLSPETNHNAGGSYSDNYSDDELNHKGASDDDNRKPHRAPRKRQSPSYDCPTSKKRRRPLQQISTREPKICSKPRRRSPKSRFPLDEGSRVTAASIAESQLRSPARAASGTMDVELLSDYNNVSGSSGDILPTLSEVTFRPHSLNCCSFTAVIRDGCDRQGVSCSQLAQLIASIGHVGKINDFTIKPIEQHSFLLTGFSWHASSRLTSSGTNAPTAAEAGRDHIHATRTGPQHGEPEYAEASVSPGSEPSSSDNDSGLTDSDPDFSGNEDGCSEKEKQGLSIRMNIPWEAVDEQRLLAYKKEGKSWEWIFGKFPGRTRPAIRTRFNMIRPRAN